MATFLAPVLALALALQSMAPIGPLSTDEGPPEERTASLLRTLVRESDAGVVVLVSREGERLVREVAGLADLEEQDPVRIDTRFRIGSITKQFTAAAILKLVEEGRIRLDDPLSKYLPDFPRGDEVTIHHLLTHTSGIHSYTNRPDFLDNVTRPATSDEILSLAASEPYDFDPGTSWSYNNSGYYILGFLIEQVSGMTYEEYLEARIFRPAGMTGTGVHRRARTLDYEAKGYSFEGEAYQPALDWDMSWAGGAGALYSTVEDLDRWIECLFAGELLNQESLEAALTPVQLPDGTQPGPPGAGYGYGWTIAEVRGVREIGHGGGLHGFTSYLARYPDHHLTVSVLHNAAPSRNLNPTLVARQIAGYFLDEAMEPIATPAVDTTLNVDSLDDYVGLYEYPGGAILAVDREGDQLYAQLTGQPRYEIVPSAVDEFVWQVVEASITFMRDDSGRVSHGIHRQGGQTLTVPRFEQPAIVEVDPALFDDYVGTYQIPAGPQMTVSREGDHLYVQATGQPRFELLPQSEVRYFMREVRADVTFVRGDDGSVSELVVNQGGGTVTAPRVE